VDTWLVVTLVAVAAAGLFALVWWISGRSRSISLDRGTAEQRFAADSNRIATMRNRDGMGPLP
jgi:hypothetical protein